MTIRTVSISSIDAGDRLRVFDPAWVKLRAEEIATDTLQQPIHIVERGEAFRLIDGARRLAALATKRWKVKTAGIVLAACRCPRTTRRRIASKIVKTLSDGDITGTVDFKSVTVGGTVWASADDAGDQGSRRRP